MAPSTMRRRIPAFVPVPALGKTPVLTGSDRARFAQTGGAIGLFLEGDRMRFTINVEAATRARVRLGPRLLTRATLVKDERVQ